MKQYTLKEVQEILDELGVERVRMLYTPRADYLTGPESPSRSVILTRAGRNAVGAQGATLDEAFDRAVRIARDARRTG